MKDPSSRQERLQKIANQDTLYSVWAHTYTVYEADFTQFANAQPKEIRNCLWGYAEAGRWMNQRIVDLACENMVFPDEP